jgi:hypothetical protein
VWVYNGKTEKSPETNLIKNIDQILEDNSVENTTYKQQMTTDNNSEKNNATLQ